MNNKNLILSSWVDESAEVMGKEAFHLIKQLSESKGVTGLFSAKFIEYFTQEAILNSLINISKQPQSNEEAYDLTKDSFTSFKIEIQQALAIAFEKAVEKYSGKPLSYYCVIRPVPEPANKYLI